MTTFADTGLRYSTPLTINSRERIVRSETLNLKTQSVSNDSQRWDIVATLEPSTSRDTSAGDENGASKLAVHKAIHGLSSSFNTKMPQHPGIAIELASGSDQSVKTIEPPDTDAVWNATTNYPKGRIVEYPQNSDAYYRAIRDTVGDQPDTSTNDWVEIDDDVNNAGDEYVILTFGVTTTLPAGLFFTFGNHSKVYMIRETLTCGGSGECAPRIFPPLVSDVPNDTVLNFTPDINVFYAPDGVEGITVTEGILTRATVSLVENLA